MNQQMFGRVDPRSKILLLISVSVLLVGGGGGDALGPYIYIALAMMPMGVLIIEGHWRSGLLMASLFVLLMWVGLVVAPSLEGNQKMALMGLVVFFTRILPAIAAGACLLFTTSVSELVCAFYKLKLPAPLITVLVIILRFFPVVLAEFIAIEQSVRMRGLTFGQGCIKRALLCRLLPFLSSTLRIGDELSAAALSRGLGASTKRTHYYQAKMTAFDLPVLMVVVISIGTVLQAWWIAF